PSCQIHRRWPNGQWHPKCPCVLLLCDHFLPEWHAFLQGFASILPPAVPSSLPESAFLAATCWFVYWFLLLQWWRQYFRQIFQPIQFQTFPVFERRPIQ